MDDDRFKLDKINILLIIVDVIIFILVIVSIILLVDSFKNESGLPELTVTRMRTTEYIPPTTTTTTRRNLVSPYYDVNVDSLLTEELLTKESVSNEEALIITKELFTTVDKIFNISDNSLLDIETTLDYAKDGEKDVITYEDKKYGIIYNSDALLKKCFSNYFLINEIGKYRYNQKRLFIKRNDNYYRLESDKKDVSLEIGE